MNLLCILRVIVAFALVVAVFFIALVVVGVFTALDSATVAYGSSGFWSAF